MTTSVITSREKRVLRKISFPLGQDKKNGNGHIQWSHMVIHNRYRNGYICASERLLSAVPASTVLFLIVT